jgi:hypothetical protein
MYTLRLMSSCNLRILFRGRVMTTEVLGSMAVFCFFIVVYQNTMLL